MTKYNHIQVIECCLRDKISAARACEKLNVDLRAFHNWTKNHFNITSDFRLITSELQNSFESYNALKRMIESMNGMLANTVEIVNATGKVLSNPDLTIRKKIQFVKTIAGKFNDIAAFLSMKLRTLTKLKVESIKYIELRTKFCTNNRKNK